MGFQAPLARTIDYREANASDPFVPNPAVLSGTGWSSLYFELHQQPKFDIAEHQHTMHIIACGLPDLLQTAEFEGTTVPGERWLDGKLERERRRAGDIALIPAGISHRCNWYTSVQFGIVAIEPALLQQVGQDWVNPDRIEIAPQFMSNPDALIQSIFSTLKTELEMGGIGGHLLVDSLTTALAIHLLRNYCTTVPKLSSYSGGLSSAQLALVTDYINAHLHQDLKLTDLSAIAQISPYHFLRLFKQSTGLTPHQYILRNRINQAKYLLHHSELSIAEIAARTGFCDQSHLTRCFKRILGTTPKQALQTRKNAPKLRNFFPEF
jgi:AraC family transcriptional regulator